MEDKAVLLSQLRDISIPEVSSTPAVGWWLLLGLLLCSVLFYQLSRRRKKFGVWKTQAEEQLQSIQDGIGKDTSADTIARCSQLARQVVLAVDQREQVAALHGNDWLNKLDDVCGRPEFSNGIGQLLVDQPYRKSPSVQEQDLNALLDSMKVLIKSASTRKRLP